MRIRFSSAGLASDHDGRRSHDNYSSVSCEVAHSCRRQLPDHDRRAAFLRSHPAAPRKYPCRLRGQRANRQSARLDNKAEVSARPLREAGLPSDHDGRRAQDDYSSVCGEVAHSRRRQISNHNRRRAFCNHIRWPHASSHIGHAGSGQIRNQHGWTTRRKYRPADVRNNTRHHRADVHIGNSCGWGHGFLCGSVGCEVPLLLCENFVVFRFFDINAVGVI